MQMNTPFLFFVLIESIHLRPHIIRRASHIGERDLSDLFLNVFCAAKIAQHVPIQPFAVKDVVWLNILMSYPESGVQDS